MATSASLLLSLLSLSLLSAPATAQKVIGWVGDAPASYAPAAYDAAATATSAPAEAASTVAPLSAYQTSMIYSPPTTTTSYPDDIVTYPTAAPTGSGDGGSYPGYDWMMTEGYKSVDCGYGYQKDSSGKCAKMTWYSAETDFGCYETRIIKEKIHVTVKETVKQVETVICTVTSTELSTTTMHETATVTHTMTDTATVAVPTIVLKTMTEFMTETMTETATKLETATEVKTDIQTETAIKTVEVPVTLTKVWETTIVKDQTLTEINTLTSVWVSTATQTKTDLEVSTATITQTVSVAETALAQCIGACSNTYGLMTTAYGYVAPTYAAPAYTTTTAAAEALITAAPTSTGGACPSAGCASGPVASKDSGSGGKVISSPEKRRVRSH